jgi:hypothetical protein
MVDDWTVGQIEYILRLNPVGEIDLKGRELPPAETLLERFNLKYTIENNFEKPKIVI